MKSKQLALVLAPLALLASAATLQDAFVLKSDKENVVSSRIEGVWILDEEDTHRIGGDKSIQGFAFTRDEKAVARIPAKHKELLANDLYLVGETQIGREKLPFVITSAHGNPRLVVFRPAADDPWGVPQSYNVMLCPAMERSKDRLFVGGEKNDRPFAVFVRRKLAPDKGG